jgi:hypothetical protein
MRQNNDRKDEQSAAQQRERLVSHPQKKKIVTKITQMYITKLEYSQKMNVQQDKHARLSKRTASV